MDGKKQYEINKRSELRHESTLLCRFFIIRNIFKRQNVLLIMINPFHFNLAD